MKSRCLDSNANFYSHYGGRGIKVCDRWLSFENFLSDMGERPSDTSLDRVDVNGHYEPGNCRWATREEQGRNRRDVYLNPEIVREIRARASAGERQCDIARSLNIKSSAVFDVVHNVRWKNV